jgi:hypothetical protein
MALTTEQQDQIEFSAALAQANAVTETKRARLEAVRLAKETLIENARSKAVGERDVTAADITTFAAALTAYIDA